MGNHVHAAIHFLAITSLQRYAHATAAQMSCYCGNRSVSKIKFPSNLNSVGKIYLQCLSSLTRSSLTRSSWQSGNRLVNALPGDVTIRTADPGWLMKTQSLATVFIIILVFTSPRPLPCINIYTRKGAGRCKHENDNKNSGKRLWMKTSGVRRFGVQFPASFGSLNML